MNICGRCKYNKFEKKVAKHDKAICIFACNNPDSDNYGCYTEYDGYCEDFEEKEK